MKTNLRIFLAIMFLATAALACQTISNGSENIPVPDVNTLPSTTQPEVSTNNSDVLLDDSFSAGRSQWGTGTDADSAVEYIDDALNIQVFTANYIVWSTPDDSSYENVHMEVTVINNGTDQNTAFGFMCDMQQPINDSRYYFAVTAGGEYAIAKASLAMDDVFLTNNDKWAKSDAIAKNAGSYHIGADCGNGKLTLYVDGEQIASVDDSTYTSGGIALFVWSASESTATTNVSFDDFKMTNLP